MDKILCLSKFNKCYSFCLTKKTGQVKSSLDFLILWSRNKKDLVFENSEKREVTLTCYKNNLCSNGEHSLVRCLLTYMNPGVCLHRAGAEVPTKNTNIYKQRN